MKDGRIVDFPQTQSDNKWICVKQYVNRWGQLMVASKYGHPYWKFIVKKG